MLFIKGGLKKFAKFTGKHQWRKCFPVNFAKCLRTPFCMGHVWWLLLIKKNNNNFRKKINNFFVLEIFFWCSIMSFLSTPAYFLYTVKLFVSTKIAFCFGYRLECYVMVIYFYCHVATRIQSHVEKKRIHFYVTRFLCLTNFLYSIFTLHIGSKLIFFVVVLEIKRNF